MKYRINEIKYKDKTMYEPQVCQKIRIKGQTGEWEVVETWDRIIGKYSIITHETYYYTLPTTIEEAEEVIKEHHRKLQPPTEPIIKTIKEYEL